MQIRVTMSNKIFCALMLGLFLVILGGFLRPCKALGKVNNQQIKVKKNMTCAQISFQKSLHPSGKAGGGSKVFDTVLPCCSTNPKVDCGSSVLQVAPDPFIQVKAAHS